MAELEIKKTEVLVLGSGPGGYSAAFRAADLGKKVILVERESTLGGVCLNVGCIPSKVLLHVAKVIEEARAMAEFGISFDEPKIDIKQLRTQKDSVVEGLTGGLSLLAKQRKVECIFGDGKFTGKNELTVGKQKIVFEQAIIAVGSQPISLPFLPDDPRIIDSTGALELKQVKGDLLVLGGGIIGMEMATIYHALGSNITVVDKDDMIVNTADKDIVMRLYKRLEKPYKEKPYKFLLKTKVTKVEAKKDGLWVTFAGEESSKPQRFDRILSAVGRKPNGKLINAEALGILVTEQGFIPVDKQLRTNVPHIFAIGDVVGNPMLAHKAVAEGHVAAEVIAGKKHFFEPRCIPSVAYTDPEIAWVGLTETFANADEKNKIPYQKAVFPWLASGRSLGQGRDEGLTKLLFDPKTQRILGAGIVGPNAGELIAEIALAIEMGCEAEDIALTIHPHPTLSETVMLASEIFEGTITDLYMPKKKTN